MSSPPPTHTLDLSDLSAEQLDPTVVECSLRLLYAHLLYDLNDLTDAAEQHGQVNETLLLNTLQQFFAV